MKKLRKLRKGLAVLLAVAIVLGLMPDMGTVKVYADEGSGSTTVEFTVLKNASTNTGNASYLLDGNASTKWEWVSGRYSNSGKYSYVIFKASAPIYVRGYSICTADNNETYPEKKPVGWTLYACNDYESGEGRWIDTIHEVTNGELPAANNATKTFSFDETTQSYQYFKLQITKTDLTTESIQLADFTLTYNTDGCEHTWGDGTVIAPTCTGYGYTKYICSTCGKEKHETITDPTGHTFEGESLKCSNCNATRLQAPSKDSAGIYQIASANDLFWFAGLVNGTLIDGTDRNTSANAVLTCNITVNEGDVAGCNGTKQEGWIDWTPIGSESNYEYMGTFDGKGYTVSGLYVDHVDDVTSPEYTGLFGRSKGQILNVNVANSYFRGKYFVGAVCGQNYGYSYSATIQNCKNMDCSVNGNRYIGGVCGNNQYANATMKNCSNAGTVSGNSNVGGVCGNNQFSNATMENCSNAGTVSGNSTVGGVCGELDNGTIKNCSNTGTVNGNNNVDENNNSFGGVCGSVKKGTTQNCYNTGAVSGNTKVGGVCGSVTGGTTQNCYNTGTISWNDSNAGGVCGYYESGTIDKCYYLDSVCPADKTFDCDKGESKTDSQFSGGEVCYLLNNSTIEGELAWYQTLDTDSLPKFEGKIVNLKDDNYINCCDEENHTYVEHERHAAVCLEGGYTIEICSTCGYVKKTYIEAEPAHHIALAGATCDICGVSDSASKKPSQNEAGVYQISTAGELIWFANNGRNVDAELTCDIKVGILTDGGSIDYYGNYIKWTPIGKFIGYYNDKGYQKHFNGNGHSVSGLYMDDSSERYVGLFGKISGVVENVSVKDSYFRSNYPPEAYIGSICGYNAGTIRNCYSTSDVISAYTPYSYQNSKYVGGFCGYNAGTIENCYSRGTVSYQASKYIYIGGISGSVYNGIIINSYYLDGCVDKTLGNANSNDGVCITAEGFDDGAIAYALQGKQVDDIWGQDLTSENSFPVLISSDASAESKKVYRFCDGESFSFSNTYTADTHEFPENGICPICGGYEEPGLADGKYQISNKGHLLWFADYVNMGHNDANAILMNDITINEGDVANCGGKLDTGWIDWNPIGNESMPYIGTFEGAGYSVIGLFGDGGLFGYLGENGKISKVKVENSYITGSNAGGVCGYNNKGTIENCSNAGTVNGNNNVGGVCGYNSEGTIKECSNTGTVNSSWYVGGVCGYNSKGTIKECSNTGTVNSSWYVGGVCGYNSEGTVEECSNTGTVSGNDRVGGVCGYSSVGTIKNCCNNGNVTCTGNAVGGVCGAITTGRIENCYNTGTVSGNTYVGGVCGDLCNSGVTIENCYNTGAVSGNDRVGGVCGNNSASGRNDNINDIYYVFNCYNTGVVTESDGDGSVNIGGVCGYNNGMLMCCYYADGTADKAVGASGDSAKENNVLGIGSSEVENGKLCYLLNKAIAGDTLLWRQTIGTDTIPTFEGKSVLFDENKDPQYYNCCEVNAHEFGEASTVDATCTEKGYTVRTCSKCGYEEITNEVSALAHTHTDNEEKCSVCGISKSTLKEPSKDESDTYLIGTAGELLWFAGLVNGTLENVSQNRQANAKLTDDIIVGSLKADGSYDYDNQKIIWTPIGKDRTYSYSGTFDGNGHTISGLYCNDETAEFVGLFGCSSSKNISNVGITDSYIKGNKYVGGVCGYASNAIITNCYNTGVVSGKRYVGGLCGYATIGSNTDQITNCYNTGVVSGNINVGGLCGYNDGRLNSCYNTGVIRGKVMTGAILGKTYSDAPVTSGYYLEDCNGFATVFDSEYGEKKTIEQFTGGEVAHKLQSEYLSEQVWGQDLSNKKSLPMLSSDTKYKVYIGCGTEKITYSNDANVQGHRYNDDGICSSCGEYEEPVWDETNTVYKISTKGNLLWFAKYINKGNTEKVNAVLQNDITLNDGDVAGCNGNRQEGWIDWTPIGNAECIYYGTFDGNGHSISGLYFNDTNTPYVGLFGRTGAYSCVKNVGVENSYLKGKSIVGGVIGCMDLTQVSVDPIYWHTGSMENCYNTGTVFGISSKDFVDYKSGVGGVCGFSYGAIKNCYNLGDVGGQSVDGDIYIGGVCGTKTRFDITNCYNAGKVTATNEGVTINSICYSYSGSTATNCYYLNDEECSTDAGDGKTADQFASGEVAYLLSQGKNGSVWRQDLGSAETTWPSLCDKMVYRYCEEGVFKYANEQHEDKHVFNKDGLCDCCGAAEKPVSVEGVYQIKNKGNLTWFANYVNGGTTNVSAVLTDDIDFTGSTFTSIGTSDNYFAGTFDGQGHTITVDQKDSDNVAIFGYIGGCTISNLTVTGTITTTVQYAAGIARRTIDNNTKTYINNCISDVTIISVMGTEESHSAGYHGGIIGQAEGYVCITNCAFTGEISGSTTHSCAGIIGTAARDVKIMNCYVSAEFNIDTSECSTYLWSSYGYKGYDLENCYCIEHIGNIVGTSTEMTKEQFASGEVAYLLSQGEAASVWGQKLGTDGDAYPVLKKTGDTGNTVYQYTNCAGNTSYTNDSALSGKQQEHDYSAEIISDDTKISDATCTEKAKYHYSCTRCEVVADDDAHVFEAGELLPHADSDKDGVCDNCREIVDAYKHLQTLITSAEAIQQGDYSDASYQTLQAAIAEAEAFTNTNTDEELTAAYNELDTVIKNLKTAKTTITTTCNPENSGILTGGGKYAVDETITLTAKAVSGYKFVGWYLGDAVSAESTDTTYEVTVTEETAAELKYIAKYEPNENNKLSITVGNGTVDYSYLDGTKIGNWANDLTKVQFAKGTYFTVTAKPNDNYTFLYWINSEGRVLTESATYSFYLGDDLELKACYKTPVESKHYVIFEDMNGKILKAVDVEMDKTDDNGESYYGIVDLPDHGIFTGYTFSKWKDAYGNVISESETGTVKITEDIVIYADYVAKTGLKLTVDGVVQGTNYTYASKVTVTADESKEGKYFSGWYIDDTRVSDSREYTFFITEDTSLTAKYDGESVIVQQPLVNMTMSDRTTLDNGKQTLIMNVTWSVPEGYTFVEGGLVRSLVDGYSDKLTFENVDGTNVKKNVSKITTAEGTYAYTLTLSTASVGKNVYAVGYIIYKNDATGDVKTIYTNTFTSTAVSNE